MMMNSRIVSPVTIIDVDDIVFRLAPPAHFFCAYADGRARLFLIVTITAFQAWTTKMTSRPSSAM
jgi:hypothetical protein